MLPPIQTAPPRKAKKTRLDRKDRAGSFASAGITTITQTETIRVRNMSATL